MNIVLPDGTQVNNIPDGTPPEKILDLLARGGYDVSQMQRDLKPAFSPGGSDQSAMAELARNQTGTQRALGGVGMGLQSAAQGIDELLPGRPLQAAAGGLADRLTRFGAGPIQQPTDLDMTGAEKGFVEGGGWQAQAGNILGKIAPTVAIPANALAKAPLVSQLASRMPRFAQVLGTMLTAGGTTAAVTPGDAATRAEAGAWSAGMAGALPAATMGVGAVRRGTTQAGRDLSRAEMIRAQLARSGQSEDDVLTALRGSYEGSKAGVQPTVGMLTENPALMRIEQGSRSRAYDVFQGLDETNAAARWSALQKIAGTPAEMEALKAAREAATTAPRQAAMFMARLDPSVTKGVADTAERMLSGASGVNPSVKTMATYVKSAIDDPNISPERLYELRKVLAGGYTPGTELGAAVKTASRERSMLIGSIDDALDSASNGIWKKYMAAYQEKSAPITSMRAGQSIEDAFSRNTPAGLVPSAMGMKPAPQTLARQISIHGQKQFGGTWKDRLLPADRDMLDVIARDLKKQLDVNLPANRVGSPTAPLLEAGEVAGDIGQSLVTQVGRMSGIPGVGEAAGAVTGAARQATKNRSEIALARLLQDPAALSDMILKARRAERVLGATTEPSRLARGVDWSE